ncbi:MAG: DUF350 domain-containing protein [Alphaproteobacteria bacterium]|nr:DUF350 domain-containing protein [Alphaproteobacteria bacterium]
MKRMNELDFYLATLPNYLSYFVAQICLIAIFTAIYTTVTPYREFTLIRQGNATAAISLVGVVIGFALALLSVSAHAGNLVDMVVWGVIALIAQLLMFVVVSRLLPGFRQGIEGNTMAYGVTLGGLSIAMGLINAGALTY